MLFEEIEEEYKNLNQTIFLMLDSYREHLDQTSLDANEVLEEIYAYLESIDMRDLNVFILNRKFDHKTEGLYYIIQNEENEAIFQFCKSQLKNKLNEYV